MEESTPEKAMRLACAGLANRRWTGAELSAPRKGDAANWKQAVQRRGEATMAPKRIAARPMDPGASQLDWVSAQRHKGAGVNMWD